MTYETTNKDTTEFVRSGIWTHILSREPKLEFGALERSAIMTFDKERQTKNISAFLKIDHLYNNEIYTQSSKIK